MEGAGPAMGLHVSQRVTLQGSSLLPFPSAPTLGTLAAFSFLFLHHALPSFIHSDSSVPVRGSEDEWGGTQARGAYSPAGEAPVGGVRVKCCEVEGRKEKEHPGVARRCGQGRSLS